MARTTQNDLDSKDSESLLPSPSPSHKTANFHTCTAYKSYARLTLELLLACTLLYLLFRPSAPAPAPTSTSKTPASPVPEFPQTLKTFTPNPRYTSPQMFTSEEATRRTLHNWIELSADARGYIKLPPNTNTSKNEYPPLPPPYHQKVDRVSDAEEEVYMLSVFHQLHCLSYLALSLSSPSPAHHKSHCLSYLLHSILCAADTTLEGNISTSSPGEGSVHVCRDIDAIREWANGNDVYKWRDGLLPGGAVL